MAMKHACNVDKCNCFDVIRRRRVYNTVCNHVRTFSTWRTRTGSSNVSQSVALTVMLKFNNMIIR